MSEYQSLDPASKQVLARFNNPDQQRIEESLALADSLYRKWQYEPIKSRLSKLLTLADVLTEQQDKLSQLIATEAKVSNTQALKEVELCKQLLRNYAEHAKFSQDAKALGVIFACQSSTYPLYQVMKVFIPNFALGNPLLLKPANSAPATAALIEKMIKQAQIDEGSLLTLYLSSSQAENLLAEPSVKALSLAQSQAPALAELARQQHKAVKIDSINQADFDLPISEQMDLLAEAAF